MHILGWLVFGLIAGAIARLLTPGHQPLGLIMTSLLGIGGSFVGGAIGNLIHGDPLLVATSSGWLGSIVGAVLILIVMRMMADRRTTV